MYPQLTNLTWSFISAFDSTLHSAFETLRESYISDKIYRIANLPSKHGGIGCRTGLHTFWTNYLPSQAKNATPIEDIAPGWDVASVAHPRMADPP